MNYIDDRDIQACPASSVNFLFLLFVVGYVDIIRFLFNSLLAIMRSLPLAGLILSSQLVVSTLQEIDPIMDMTNLLTSDGSSIMDDILMEDSDLSQPSFNQVPDEFLTSFTDLTAAESESCPMGKKRDGKSCAAPITIEIPNLLNVFGTGGGSDQTDPSSDSDIDIWKLNHLIDPCELRVPYTIHVCCYGELGRPYGVGWESIDKCELGTYSIPPFRLSF